MADRAMTIVGTREMSAMEQHAAYIEEKREEIIRTYIPEAFQKDAAVIGMFLDLCKARGLNPFARQIYCVPRGKKASIEPSIDGLRLIASRSRVFAGIDEYEYDTETAKTPTWARCTVYRIVDGIRCGFTSRVLWSEFGATGYTSSYENQWKTRPYHMLGIRAEAHALRKAFPEETSGLYSHEEMETDGPTMRYVDADGVLQEPTAIRLPLGLRPEQWDNLCARGRKVGIDFDPLMTDDQLVGAIRKAGGSPIPGQITATAVNGALNALYALRQRQENASVPVSDAAPIRDDEILVEQAALVNGGR